MIIGNKISTLKYYRLYGTNICLVFFLSEKNDQNESIHWKMSDIYFFREILFYASLLGPK